MPPKRKSARNSAATNRSSKRLKINDNEINGKAVRWEWENDGGVWTVYNSDHCSAITKSYHQNKPTCLLKLPGGVNANVIFKTMAQNNVKTGWQRRLRLAVNEDKNDFYVWEWKDNDGSWQPTLSGCAAEMESTYQGDGKTLDVEIAGQDYSIDLVKMTQINNSTGFKRDIRRLKSAAVFLESNDDEVDDAKSVASSIKEESVSEDEEPATKSGKKKSGAKKGRSGKSAAKGGKSANKNGETKSTIRKLIKKGAAPVDSECSSKVDVAHVYSEGSVIWDCMLNQTNLQFNNNKYYLIQLLEDDNKTAYTVWMRWGRVGKAGQTSLMPCGSNLDQAKKTFCKKFQDKTKNSWPVVGKFEKIPGKYDLVHVDYSNDNVSEDAASLASIDYPDSKLEASLQGLIQLICDVKSMEDAVIEMKYDTKKAPLGKLNPDQIKAGYSALKEISELVDDPKSPHSLLLQACNDFYTRIPHDFGMKVPPIIRTKQEVKLKIQLLEALSDIEIAMNIIKAGDSDENPVDSHYKSLKCDICSLNRSDTDFQMVEDYLLQTHASTHAHYKMKIVDLYAIKKEEDSFNDVGNKMLLWHGSRLTNWVGILSRGLRIAPPEAPVTGYMFGKGVYFADMSSKSANYCFTTKAKNVGLLLLCEVALGNVNELLNADYNADKLPAGKHSVKGLGAIAPNEKHTFTMPDGTKVPLGKPTQTGVKNPAGYTLNYNEFIVYDTKQIKMKYLVKVQFDFK